MRHEAIEVRGARAEDAEPLFQVMCAAFGLDCALARPVFHSDPFFDLLHKRVLVSADHGLLSCLTIIPTQMRVGNAIIPVAGVAGVATDPKFQRRGYAATLLTETLHGLADELAFPVSALFPYSYRYYARFGWETASHTAFWTAVPESLPAYSDAHCVRPIRASEHAVIHTLYHDATLSRTGACLRDDRRWRVIEVLIPGRDIVVYADEEGIGGYLLYEPPSVNGTIVIHEMQGVSVKARRGLIGFLARQKSNASRLEWNAGIEDLRSFGLLPFAIAEHGQSDEDQRLPSIVFKRGVMFRLVDVKAALAMVFASNYAPVLFAGEMLTIRTQDTVRAENNVPVRISQIGITPGDIKDKSWIECDVRVLVQLYLGYRTPSDAASVEDLRVSSDESLALADRLFPLRNPFFADPDEF